MQIVYSTGHHPAVSDVFQQCEIMGKEPRIYAKEGPLASLLKDMSAADAEQNAQTIKNLCGEMVALEPPEGGGFGFSTPNGSRSIRRNRSREFVVTLTGESADKLRPMIRKLLELNGGGFPVYFWKNNGEGSPEELRVSELMQRLDEVVAH